MTILIVLHSSTVEQRRPVEEQFAQHTAQREHIHRLLAVERSVGLGKECDASGDETFGGEIAASDGLALGGEEAVIVSGVFSTEGKGLVGCEVAVGFKRKLREKEPVPRSDHDIGGFNVSVPDVFSVDLVEGTKQLKCEPELVDSREDRKGAESLAQVGREVLPNQESRFLARCDVSYVVLH